MGKGKPHKYRKRKNPSFNKASKAQRLRRIKEVIINEQHKLLTGEMFKEATSMEIAVNLPSFGTVKDRLYKARQSSWFVPPKAVGEPVFTGEGCSTGDNERLWLIDNDRGNQGILKRSGNNSSSEQNIEEPVRNEEIIVPDVEMRCFENTGMEKQSAEIIELELEPTVCYDPSFNLSTADGDGHSKTERDGQNPSTSNMTLSESLNSNVDTHPDEYGHAAAELILPHGLRTVKDKSDVSTRSSCSNESSISNSTDHRNSTKNRTQLITGSKNSPSNKPNQTEVSSHSDSLSFPEDLSISRHEDSRNNESTLPKVRTHHYNNPSSTKDNFDAFGEFIASKLRHLDTESCAFVQTAFKDIIHKAELGMFRNKK